MGCWWGMKQFFATVHQQHVFIYRNMAAWFPTWDVQIQFGKLSWVLLLLIALVCFYVFSTFSTYVDQFWKYTRIVFHDFKGVWSFGHTAWAKHAWATQMLYKLCSWRSMAFKITEYNSGIVQKMINVSGKLYLNLQSGESCSHFSACKTHVADVAKNWVILRQQHTPWWYITQQDYVGPCSQALLDQLTCVNPSSAYFIWSYTLNWCILDTHDDDSMIENKFLHDWFAHWFLYTEDSTNACLKY